MTKDLEMRVDVSRWLRGESSSAQAQELVQKLLLRMVNDHAQSITVRPEFVSPALEAREPADYEEVVSQAVEVACQTQKRLEAERRQANVVLKGLLESGSATREQITDSPATDTWGLVHGLLADYWETDHPDPAQAVELARLGVRLALELDSQKYGSERVQDLRALAYAKLGNTLRIQSEFRSAENAFSQASEYLEQGTEDPLVEARVRYAEASLYGIQERFDKAFQLLAQVTATAQRFRDSHLLGKALISRAYFESNAGQTEEGLRLLHRGLRHIDPTQEPRLVLVAWHNLILTLTYQDRYREAAERLPYIRSLHQKFGNRQDHLRLQWVEGRINLARGEEDQAEKTLEEVRENFIDTGVGFDAALVSLDLAHVYARQGRSEDMRRLAQEMIPIFESRDMHREAIAALLVFKKATEMDQVSVHLVEDLTAFLRRSRGNPKLRFHPPF